MRYYLMALCLLVAICHKLYAESVLPLPEPMPNCPMVYLPPDLDYANRLIHLYNAHVTNPNLIVPNCERLRRDSSHGMQGWLPCVPNLAEFSDALEYPMYRDKESGAGLYVLFLPPDSGGIGEIIKNGLTRCIEYQCKADGFPQPRPGQVSTLDYQQHKQAAGNTLYLGSLIAGVLLGVALLLMQLFFQRLRRCQRATVKQD